MERLKTEQQKVQMQQEIINGLELRKVQVALRLKRTSQRLIERVRDSLMMRPISFETPINDSVLIQIAGVEESQTKNNTSLTYKQETQTEHILSKY